MLGGRPDSTFCVILFLRVAQGNQSIRNWFIEKEWRLTSRRLHNVAQKQIHWPDVILLNLFVDGSPPRVKSAQSREGTFQFPHLFVEFLKYQTRTGPCSWNERSGRQLPRLHLCMFFILRQMRNLPSKIVSERL